MKLEFYLFLSVIFITPLLFKKILNFILNISWEPESAQLNDYIYYYSIDKKEHRISNIKIGLSTIDGCDFCLKREGVFDRIAKKLGISDEIQFNNDKLNNLVYVLSDQPDVISFINDINIQNNLLEIFNFKTFNCSVNRIECHSGKIWVSLQGSSHVQEKHIEFIAIEILSNLYAINTKIMQSLLRRDLSDKDLGFKKSAFISAISQSFFIYGFFRLYLKKIYPTPIIISPNNSFFLALAISMILCFAFSYLAIIVLKKSSRTHLALIEIFTVGILGLFMTSFISIIDINMVFDNSSPIENVVNVYKTEHHKGKWFDSYQLTLGIDAENKFRIPVEEDVYFNSLNEKKLTIIQHQGLLNQSWISEYKYNK